MLIKTKIKHFTEKRNIKNKKIMTEMKFLVKKNTDSAFNFLSTLYD